MISLQDLRTLGARMIQENKTDQLRGIIQRRVKYKKVVTGPAQRLSDLDQSDYESVLLEMKEELSKPPTPSYKGEDLVS